MLALPFQLCLGKVFHWYQGYRVACQAPAEQESVGIKLPGASEEKPEESDADLAKRDIVLVGLYSECIYYQ